jgi:hypothetical protein
MFSIIIPTMFSDDRIYKTLLEFVTLLVWVTFLLS